MHRDPRKAGRTGFIALLGLTLCTVCTSVAQPQIPPPASKTPTRTAPALIPRTRDQREQRYQSQHRIVLKALVTDTSGQPVLDLKEHDVTLLDNGRPQTLTSFQAVQNSTAARPSRVILLIDTLNNSGGSIEQDRLQVQKYLRESPPVLSNSTAIAILTGSGTTIEPASRDRETLLQQVRQVKERLHPVICQNDPDANRSFLNVWMPNAPATLRSTQVLACLNERFERSVSALQKFAAQQESIPGRVLLIWLGPGWPLLNEHEFTPDNATTRETFFHYLVELSTTLRESQVTLDAISSPDTMRKNETRNDHDNAFLDGVPSEDDTTAGSLCLEALAHQSGGLLLSSSKDIAAEISQAIAAESVYYVLSFDSPPAATPAEFHAIRVTIGKPGIKIRTNTLYYNQP